MSNRLIFVIVGILVALLGASLANAQLGIYVPVAYPQITNIQPNPLTVYSNQYANITFTIYNNANVSAPVNIYINCNGTNTINNYELPAKGSRNLVIQWTPYTQGGQPYHILSVVDFSCRIKVSATYGGNFNSTRNYSVILEPASQINSKYLTEGGVTISAAGSSALSTIFTPGEQVNLHFNISGGTPPYSTSSYLDCSGGNATNENNPQKITFLANTTQITMPSYYSYAACFIGTTVTDAAGTQAFSESGTITIETPGINNFTPPNLVNPLEPIAIFIIAIIIVVLYMIKFRKGKAKGIINYIGAVLIIFGITGFVGGLIIPNSSCSNNGFGWVCHSSTGGTILTLVESIILMVVGYVLITRTKREKVGKGGKIKERAQNTALDTLKRRYANGEITKKQYETMKKDLEE